jgi:hypothetical protein
MNDPTWSANGLQQLREVGLKLDGRLTITTELPVVQQNSDQSAQQNGGATSYKWHLTLEQKEPPLLVLQTSGPSVASAISIERTQNALAPCSCTTAPEQISGVYNALVQKLLNEGVFQSKQRTCHRGDIDGAIADFSRSWALEAFDSFSA